MKRLALALGCLLAAGPVAAQSPTPSAPTPSALGTRPPGKTQPAPHPPVVHAQPNTHAQKPAPQPKPKSPITPASKPAAKPAPQPAPIPAPVPAPTQEPPAAAPDPNKGSVTGLPIPRFMALRFDDVNLRVGPGTRYPIDWVYHRRDLPVEVIRELEDWRLVQDQDNVRGWVRAQTLSPRRGLVVRGAEHALRSKPADDAPAVALLKPGVVGHLRACATTAAWCEAEVGQYRGWLKRDDIYGVYTAEAFGG
jgi:SH3-like domain-containing protein